MIGKEVCILKVLNVFALVWRLSLNYNIEGAQGGCAVFSFPSQSNGNIPKKPNMQSIKDSKDHKLIWTTQFQCA